MQFHSSAEQIVYNELKNLGWNIQAEPRFHIPTDGSKFYIPDFALYGEDGNLFGIGEVLTNRKLCELRKVEALQRVAQSSFVQVGMITNGFAYDIYVNGKFATQTNICPSMEVCQFLIRRLATHEGGESNDS